LHASELIGRLGAVAQGQLGLGVEFAGLFDLLHEVLDGDLAEDVAGALGVAHVLAEHGGHGAAPLGDGLAGVEVDDLVRLAALVGLAPAEDGDVDHERTPWVVREERSWRAQAASSSPSLGTGGWV